MDEVEKELRRIREREEPRRRDSSTSTPEESTSQGQAGDLGDSSDILGSLRKKIRLEREQEQVLLTSPSRHPHLTLTSASPHSHLNPSQSRSSLSHLYSATVRLSLIHI